MPEGSLLAAAGTVPTTRGGRSAGAHWAPGAFLSGEFRGRAWAMNGGFENGAIDRGRNGYRRCLRFTMMVWSPRTFLLTRPGDRIRYGDGQMISQWGGILEAAVLPAYHDCWRAPRRRRTLCGSRVLSLP